MAENIRTDMLVPDDVLNQLRIDLQSTNDTNERKRISDAIANRKIEIARAFGVSSIGEAGGDLTLIPEYSAANEGKLILQPAGPEGLYTAMRYDARALPGSEASKTDPVLFGRDPYGTVSATDEGGNQLYFDKNGNPVSLTKAGEMMNAWNATGKTGASSYLSGSPIAEFYSGGTATSATATGSTATSATSATSLSDLPAGVTVVSTYSDPTTGDVTAVLSNGTTRVLAKSGAQTAERKSAYDLLYQEFNNLGIGGLVPELKTFIEEGVSPAEFTLRLRQTESYKKRFAANAQRVAKGLRALSEAEYIGLEDQYQNVMRQYGLPETYYTRGEMGKQEGFEKFIAGDVSAAELEDRISTAQKRVINANPEVTQALKTFYPGISQGDILAYTLDPSKAIEDIKRKITAAEIGGAAVRAGLTTSVADAEYLQRYGVTKEQADQGYQAAAQIVPRASQLADIYKQGPYTQATAEQEIFNLPGQVEAQKQRKKLTELETSAFSGRAGVGAIARERAGAF